MLLLFAIVHVVQAGDIDRFHPNTSYRDLANERYEQGYAAQALVRYLRAARYADKTSQMAIALMHFHGEATPVNRAAAYAWADLAAERGYPQFLQTRETIWDSLSEDERAEALKIGERIYAEYGDAVAKPRLNRLLIQGRRQATGSKTGFIGSLSVGVTEGGQGTRPGSLSGENRALQNLLSMTRTVRDYYDDKYWDPEIYWTYQDAIWLLPAAGTVEVDPLRPASTSSDN